MDTTGNNRVDLGDVTFVSVVRIESADRRENWSIVSRYLFDCFHTNMIVLEADKEPRLEPIGFDGNYLHLFREDVGDTLHWTRYINYVVNSYVRTPIVALYDIDAILPPGQIVATVELIRSGKYKCVSPYDGTYLLVDAFWKSMFADTYEIKSLVNNRTSFKVHTRRSYGGVIFFDSDCFRASGMENETFDSWGVLDYERVKRFSILGYPVGRVPGELFHLHHHRGSNSNFLNMESRIRFYREYLKICAMEKDELRQYVDQWSWTKKNPVNERTV